MSEKTKHRIAIAVLIVFTFGGPAVRTLKGDFRWIGEAFTCSDIGEYCHGP